MGVIEAVTDFDEVLARAALIIIQGHIDRKYIGP